MSESDNTRIEEIGRSPNGSVPSAVAPSRRAVLGTLAASALAGASTVPALAQEDDDALDDESAETGADADDADLEVVADFDPPELPENIAIDEDGTIYLSLAITGEILAIDPDGEDRETVAQLDVGEEGLLLGLVVDDGTIHAALNSGEADTHGVWRVDATGGDAERVAELPADETEPNGIVHDPYDPDALLVSDHRGGAIWRVAADGAEPWVDHEVLDPDPEAEPGVGADGLAVHPDGDVYVDNLDYGRIVRVPVDDGSAGDPELVVEDESLVGADGMTVDEDGTLYVAVNARDAIARIDLEEPAIDTVAEGGVLDFPADVSFGRTEADATSLYACNFALERFMGEADPEPSLVRLEVGAAGFFGEPGESADGEDGHDDEHGHDGEDHDHEHDGCN